MKYKNYIREPESFMHLHPKRLKNIILRKSAIPYNEWGNGAEKRSAQVHSILLKHGIKVLDIDTPAPKKTISFLYGLRFVVSNFFRVKMDRFFWERLISIGRTYAQLNGILKNFKGESVILWDYNIFNENFILPYVARRFKFKTIAIPHNLESLVPGQQSPNTGKVSPNWFSEEIKHLKKCDAVFTISREENWLLRLHAVNAHYLPYFPADAVYENLISIRNTRLHKSNFSNFLWLGSYGNGPTALGIEELLLNASKLKTEERILIGGHGTAEIKLKISAPFEILGTLDQNTLNEIMINCKAIIINQKISSGSLTKIIEFMVAGIPIISNTDALRSYQNIKGIYSFDSLEELSILLSLESFDMPPLVENIDLFENKFIQTIELTIKSACND